MLAAVSVTLLLVLPIKYESIDYAVLLPYLAGVLLTFSVGFIGGARGRLPADGCQARHALSLSYERIQRPVVFVLLLFLASGSLDLIQLLNSAKNLGFLSIGARYVEVYSDYERGGASVDLNYVANIVADAFTMLAIVTFFYYRSVVSKKYRIMFYIGLFAYVFVGVIGYGKQKQIGDIAIFILYATAIAVAGRRLTYDRRALVLSVILAGIFSIAFLEVLRQRYSIAGIHLGNIDEVVHPLVRWNADSYVLTILPERYALSFVMFASYFTNGLYGLYLCLSLPFEWTYMIGNSYALSRIAEIISDSDGTLIGRTYPLRAGEVYGWGLDKWHTTYSWLASDVTFLGVFGLVLLFSFLYGKLWVQSLSARNPISGPLFIYLSLGLVFSFANNQLVHSLAGVMSLSLLTGAWFVFELKARMTAQPSGKPS
jgi:hypothetical protein